MSSLAPMYLVSDYEKNLAGLGDFSLLHFYIRTVRSMLFNFTLKTDDDCFVNVDEILKVSFTAILFCVFVCLFVFWRGQVPKSIFPRPVGVGA